MKIIVAWGDSAQTSLLLRFQHGWTWTDLKQAGEQADSMIVSQPHTVHLIIDLRQAGGLPRDFLSAANELFARGEARSNEGLRIVVGAGLLLRTAYQSLMALYGRQLENRPFLFASSLDEAQTLITST